MVEPRHSEQPLQAVLPRHCYCWLASFDRVRLSLYDGHVWCDRFVEPHLLLGIVKLTKERCRIKADDIHTQTRQCVAKLQSDRSESFDGDPPRQIVQFQDLIRRQHACVVEVKSLCSDDTEASEGATDVRHFRDLSPRRS